MHKVIHKEQDMTGKFRVWVELESGDVLMLKFQDEPYKNKIAEVFKKIILMMERDATAD